MGRATKWVIGGVVAVAVIVVGGPFVYIHFIEGPPKKALSLDDVSSSPSPGASAAPLTTVDGSWKVASGSQVGYRVKETLFGQSTTAVGRTPDVSGTVTISATTVSAATFTAQTTTLTSDQGGRDQQVQGRILETSEFPTGGFTLTKPITLTSVADGVAATGTATGTLELHGVTKEVTFSVASKRTGSSIAVTGSIPIHFADYSIDNPSGGPAQTGDDGTLEFLLVLTKS